MSLYRPIAAWHNAQGLTPQTPLITADLGLGMIPPIARSDSLAGGGRGIGYPSESGGSMPITRVRATDQVARATAAHRVRTIRQLCTGFMLMTSVAALHDTDEDSIFTNEHGLRISRPYFHRQRLRHRRLKHPPA